MGEIKFITFKEILLSRIEKSKNVLANKAKEYAFEKGRYHNFIEAGGLINELPIRVALLFGLKHFQSLIDIVEDRISFSEKEICEEKIGDSFNYCIIMLGMLLYTDDFEKVYKLIKAELKTESLNMYNKNDLLSHFKQTISLLNTNLDIWHIIQFIYYIIHIDAQFQNWRD